MKPFIFLVFPNPDGTLTFVCWEPSGRSFTYRFPRRGQLWIN